MGPFAKPTIAELIEKRQCSRIIRTVVFAEKPVGFPPIVLAI